MAENRLSSISKARNIEEMGSFWDTHDFTEYDTDAPDVEFTVSCAVPIELELLSSIEEQARREHQDIGECVVKFLTHHYGMGK